MNKKFLTYSIIAGVLLLLFCALTVALCCVDVREVGESSASVGFATLNEWAWNGIGQSETALAVSDVLGLLFIAAVGAFGVTGLVQVIRRKGILRADKELYAMAGGLVLLAAAYVLFEVLVINYRPVLEDGELAASYPSSHAMLAVAVAGMGMAYLQARAKKGVLTYTLYGALNVLSVVTIACRVLGGVHWVTDIVGGVLLGSTIAAAYRAVCAWLAKKGERA